ncbi:hypothetical protein [Ornithinimicrobium kibberense]|uniref:hypothetical protein n=1 Tax=Ornithinimicrobium kibberense TaxID=282060 RepID=UPI003622B52F
MVRPAASRSSTCRSRSLSSGKGTSSGGAGAPIRAKNSATRAASEAPKTTPPAAAERIARSTSSAPAPLSR